MNEQAKYETIKALAECGGNKKRAALTLGCTVRTVNRQIKGYRENGKAFFVHGNRGKKPAHALPAEKRTLISDLYRTKYFDCNFEFFAELLEKEEKISVSGGTVRNILMKDGLFSPKATRATKKRIKRELKERKAATKSKKEAEAIQSNIVALEDAHSRRPRCANFGEMIQMDACLHHWFGEGKSTLHLGVDDATGMIVGAYFDGQETLDGYYHVFLQILTGYGIPYMFFTDRRTVFEYRSKAEADKKPENDTFTQFGYACKQLGVEIKTSSVPQAKGRVERMFQTLQGRLPILLRLAGITTIERANEFLNSYIKEYNAKFALTHDNIPSVFEKQPEDEKINLTLAVLAPRKIDAGHSVRYGNKYFKTMSKNGTQTCFRKGTAGLVVKALDKSLYFVTEDEVYSLEEIPEHERISKNFDTPKPKMPPKPRYVPPMSHPWRKKSFENYMRKQVHSAYSLA
jgi:transposase